MKTKMLIILAALVVSVTLSRANITGYDLADDGDGVITCEIYGISISDPKHYELGVFGTHNSAEPGHIEGSIFTDGTDPVLTLYQFINNETLFTWSDYHVQITMGTDFSILNVGITNNNWYSQTTQPTQSGSVWIGSIDYYAGDLIPPGDSIGFNYSVSFTSSSGAVSFSEQLTPTVVPEPGTFAVSACGLAGLLVLRRRLAS